MTKKDILELKRRMKKEACTFTKLCGCYVDGNKNIILKINETFLNLKDEEFFKYLDIAKKALSGTIGNNLLELEFAPVGDVAAINSFTGEYMMPYSWAEYTTGMLVNKYEKFI